MGVITHGSSLPDSSQKTDFYGIIDNATVSNIVDADISAGAAISDTKLNTITTAAKVNVSALTGQIIDSNLAQITTAAKVSASAITNLANTPSGAGILPLANIGNLLGAWTTKSEGTTYQAATDGFVVGYGVSTSGGSTVNIYTDSSNPPTTIRANFPNDNTYASGFMCPVRKNDYYKVDNGGRSTTVYWIPLGS